MFGCWRGNSWLRVHFHLDKSRDFGSALARLATSFRAPATSIFYTM